MNLTIPDFKALVVRWANDNIERIRTVWPLAGGWEAWAQAEIAGAINRTVPDSTVVREPEAYPGRGRADFLVNNSALNPFNDLLVVEMKCESFRNWKKFVDELKYDAWKLSGDLGPYNTSGKLAFGIFFSPESGDKLAQLSGFELVFTDPSEIGLAFLTL